MLSTFVSASLLLAAAIIAGFVLAREIRALGSRKMRLQPIRLEQHPVKRRQR